MAKRAQVHAQTAVEQVYFQSRFGRTTTLWKFENGKIEKVLEVVAVMPKQKLVARYKALKG